MENKKIKPVSLNWITGGIFAAIALISLIRAEYVEMTIWLTIGFALVLADMYYLPKGADVSMVPKVPKWRRYVSVMLIAIGMAGFGYIVGKDVKAKADRSNTEVSTSNSTSDH